MESCVDVRSGRVRRVRTAAQGPHGVAKHTSDYNCSSVPIAASANTVNLSRVRLISSSNRGQTGNKRTRKLRENLMCSLVHLV